MAVLRQYPNGMGGYVVCYPPPTNTRDANEWLNRDGVAAQGFKFNSKNNGRIHELRQNGKILLRVIIKNSNSIIPICQMAAKKYGIQIDWYNISNWTNRFNYPEDIQIIVFDK